ncbi:MAG: GTP-binding protein [Parvibaculaceae bacterium]
MSAVPRNRIRLLVVSGFLGSGKTTWLRHQLHAGRLRDRAVIVNEAAAAPVDEALLADLARVTVISGGCACCSRREAFLAVLRGHCNENRPRDVVLETSGLAEPAAIVAAVRDDPMLVHRILIEEVVATVDALSALARLAGDRLARAQVSTADALIVTKLDAADPQTAGRLAATLEALNPGARITGAVKGEEVALPDHAHVLPQPLPVLDGLAEAGPVVAADVDIDPAMGWEVFSVWLSALLHVHGDDILRIKGVVRTPNGRVLLQCVQKAVLPPEILPEAPAADCRFDNRLAFIGRGFDKERLKRSLAAFCS